MALLSVCLLLTGCATIIEGTTQKITVQTDPPGAECSLWREGKEIGTIAATPGTVSVEKTKHDITIACNKSGYDEASLSNRSDLAAATFGNIVAGRVLRGVGGLIARGVDSATGADNKYDSEVTITLVKTPPTMNSPAPLR